MKTCTKCGETKAVEEFHWTNKNKTTRRPACKACAKIRCHSYYTENKDTLLEGFREYRQEHKEELKEYRKDYCIKNKEKIAEWHRAHYQANRDDFLSKQQEYYQNNREDVSEYKKRYRNKNIKKLLDAGRIYYQDNKEEMNRKGREYREANIEKIAARNRYRYANDPDFRMRRTIRGATHRVFNGKSKDQTTRELIGCSFAFFKAHIEKQFTKGMNWDNQGEWHYDHIIPLNSFDLSDPEERRKACHYSNFQPLWGKDNYSKGATVPDSIHVPLELQL